MGVRLNPKKILLTGATGQVGWDLSRALAPLGGLITPDSTEFNLAEPESLRKNIREWKPDIIVNPAAYTAVDQAEREHDLVFRVNADSPKVLAEEAERLNIPMIHYSTDYVFDGEKGEPYRESDETRPLNIYGESKLQGEMAIQNIVEQHIILRTSWIYSLRGSNFLTTMLRLFKEKDEISVVNDQIGAPTWSRMVAEVTSIIMSQLHQKENGWGLYHLSASGESSWYHFVKEIKRVEDEKRKFSINAISSEQYVTAAIRPKNSLLNSRKLSQQWNVKLPGWDVSLKQCLESL
jgi:dTDP-4-dehydrorhamnose reductase